jgi:hypothetical protein
MRGVNISRVKLAACFLHQLSSSFALAPAVGAWHIRITAAAGGRLLPHMMRLQRKPDSMGRAPKCKAEVSGKIATRHNGNQSRHVLRASSFWR